MMTKRERMERFCWKGGEIALADIDPEYMDELRTKACNAWTPVEEKEDFFRRWFALRNMLAQAA